MCLVDKLVGAGVPCGGGNTSCTVWGGNQKLHNKLRLIFHI